MLTRRWLQAQQDAEEDELLKGIGALLEEGEREDADVEAARREKVRRLAKLDYDLLPIWRVKKLPEDTPSAGLVQLLIPLPIDFYPRSNNSLACRCATDLVTMKPKNAFRGVALHFYSAFKCCGPAQCSTIS